MVNTAYTQKLAFVPSPPPRFPSIGNLDWGFGNEARIFSTLLSSETPLVTIHTCAI